MFKYVDVRITAVDKLESTLWVHIFTSAKKVVFAGVYLSVCLFVCLFVGVSKITRKVVSVY